MTSARASSSSWNFFFSCLIHRSICFCICIHFCICLTEINSHLIYALTIVFVWGLPWTCWTTEVLDGYLSSSWDSLRNPTFINPLLSHTVPSILVTSFTFGVTIYSKINLSMGSPNLTSRSSSKRLHNTTLTSPRQCLPMKHSTNANIFSGGHSLPWPYTTVATDRYPYWQMGLTTGLLLVDTTILSFSSVNKSNTAASLMISFGVMEKFRAFWSIGQQNQDVIE